MAKEGRVHFSPLSQTIGQATAVHDLYRLYVDSCTDSRHSPAKANYCTVVSVECPSRAVVDQTQVGQNENRLAQRLASLDKQKSRSSVASRGMSFGGSCDTQRSCLFVVSSKQKRPATWSKQPGALKSGYDTLLNYCGLRTKFCGAIATCNQGSPGAKASVLEKRSCAPVWPGRQMVVAPATVALSSQVMTRALPSTKATIAFEPPQTPPG